VAELTNGATPLVIPAVYQLVYQSVGGLGTGQLEISKDNGATYQVMIDGAFTTSEDRIAYLGYARLRVTLTGDAKIWLDKIIS
jgi:hypothetical protein